VGKADIEQDDNYEFLCHIGSCGKTYKRMEYVYRHITARHYERITVKPSFQKRIDMGELQLRKPTECFICGRGVRDRDDLNRHLGNIHRDAELEYRVSIAFKPEPPYKIQKVDGIAERDLDLLQSLRDDIHLGVGRIFYPEEELRRHLGITRDKSCADGMFENDVPEHFIIVEGKGKSGVEKALEQIRATITHLEDKHGDSIHIPFAIIFMEGFGNYMKKVWGRYEKTFQLYFNERKGKRKEISMGKTIVYLMKREDKLSKVWKCINMKSHEAIGRPDPMGFFKEGE